MEQLPPDAVMKQMAKLAIEQSNNRLAGLAEEFADEMERGDGPQINGVDALRVFATAIRNSNQTLYPPKGTA